MANPYGFGTARPGGGGAIAKLKKYRCYFTIFGVVVLLAIVPTVLILATRDNPDDYEDTGTFPSRKNATSTPSPHALTSWQDRDMTDIPAGVKEKMDAVTIEDHTLELTTDGQNAEVFSLRVTPPATTSLFPILLLHGAAFSSKNWADIETLQLLGAMGHPTVAIDVPGYGKSTSQVSLSSAAEKADFVAAYIEHEKLGRPVIVSPSMSGSFSIPYIMSSEPSTCTERARGYIPVAPVGTDAYTQEQYRECKVPTMIVYGSNDKGLGVMSLEDLRNLPNSGAFPLQDAGHAAYLDKPAEWHRLLYNFVLALDQLEDK